MTAGKRAVGELLNHLIIDSAVFIYTRAAPQPYLFLNQGRGYYGAKHTETSLFYDAFAPNEMGF